MYSRSNLDNNNEALLQLFDKLSQGKMTYEEAVKDYFTTFGGLVIRVPSNRIPKRERILNLACRHGVNGRIIALRVGCTQAYAYRVIKMYTKNIKKYSE